MIKRIKKLFEYFCFSFHNCFFFFFFLSEKILNLFTMNNLHILETDSFILRVSNIQPCLASSQLNFIYKNMYCLTLKYSIDHLFIEVIKFLTIMIHLDTFHFHSKSFYEDYIYHVDCPVGWGCRIHRLLLCRRVKLPSLQRVTWLWPTIYQCRWVYPTYLCKHTLLTLYILWFLYC